MRDYEGRSPSLLIGPRHWSARWTGCLDVPVTADYEFFSQSDDGLRLWIDGEILIDNWKIQTWLRSGYHARRRLTAGRHSLKLEFFNCGAPAALRVRWEGGPIIPNRTIAWPYLKKY